MIHIIWIVSIFFSYTSAQYVFQPLKNTNSQIDVVPYTAAQRTLVAQSVKSMLEVLTINKIYVNRQSKIDNYGKQYVDIDPLPRVQKIIENAATMADLEFHYKFVDIFKSLRDFHTTYSIPGPHGCIVMYKAVVFDVIGEGRTEKIIASSFYSSQILDLSPNAKRIQIGDELISIAGIPTLKYLKSLAFTTGGANEAGSFRAALLSLSRIDGRFSKLPNKNSLSFEFKSTEGKKFAVNLPWITATDSDCWMQSKKVIIGIQTNDFTLSPLKSTSKSIRGSQDQADNDLDQLVKPKHSSSAFRFHKTSQEFLSWNIYSPNSKKLGIIVISSFETTSTHIKEIIKVIRNLLLNELRDTSSLLIDVRSNLGGTVNLADHIPQLFGPDIKIGSFRSLVGPINKELMLEYSGADWEQAYMGVKRGDTYTPLVQVTTNLEANLVGQAYTKPVGVFTNGQCYSACDMFTAHMKDNNLATIFGEDSQTGGGGANVVDYNSYLAARLPQYYPLLPFVNEMPLGAQYLHVSWIQMLRLDGSLVEDTGVKTDIMVRPNIADLTSDFRSLSQYDRIADILIKQGVKSGKKNLAFTVYPENEIDLRIGQNLAFNFFTSGYSKISVYDEGGHILESIEVNHSLDDVKNSIVLGTSEYYPRLTSFSIKGFDARGKLVFSTERDVRFTPELKNYLQIQSSKTIEFTTHSLYTGWYDNSFEFGTGWVVDNKRLTLGPVAEGVDAVVSFFLNTPSDNSIIHIQGKYFITSPSDYFRIGILQESKNTILFDTETAGFSSNSKYKHFEHSFPLPAGRIELFFKFHGDDTKTSRATIEKLQIFK